MALETIIQSVKPELQKVNQLIKDSLASDVSLINDISYHLINSGGKRIRPLLVLLCAKACEYAAIENHHICLAAVIEFIHTATLLHDDVVDSSTQRRGKKTANHVWNNQAAVLVGDFLYSRAFQMMVTVQDMRILDVIADATNKIAEGEVLQLLSQQDPSISEAQYMQTIEFKTAKLFEASTLLGALLGNVSQQHLEAMRLFGKHLGLAYQLIDDSLDYQPSNNDLGKNTGDDLAEGKVTLPLIYLLHQANLSVQALVKQAIQNPSRNYWDDLQQALNAYPAIDYTVNKAKEHVQFAKNQLDYLPSSPYKHALSDLCNFIVERQY